MTAARRVFVLLGAYEGLTERETGALRRGDIEHVVSLEGRKLRLVEALKTARRNAGLSNADNDALLRRVRCLETQEKQNLSVLREEMARVRQSLAQLSRATHRSRQVRRGYVGASFGPTLAEGMLGRA